MSDPVLRNWSDEELLKFIQSSGVNSSMGMGDYAVDAGRASVTFDRPPGCPHCGSLRNISQGFRASL